MQYFQKAIRSIIGQVFIVALFFLLYHKIMVIIMREASLSLGAVKHRRDFVPYYAIPEVNLSLWILPALVICIGFLFLCYRYIHSNNISYRKLILIAFVCFIAINISVAQIDGFREIENEQILTLFYPYTRSGLEYYEDVPRLEEIGLRTFLRDFSKPYLFDTLTGHTRTHPPGGVVFLWIVSKVFGYNLISASLASVLFTTLVIVPIYKLAERLYDQKVALCALLLFLVTPNFVMFTTTSMDGPFSVFPILSLYLFYEARHKEIDPETALTKFRPYSLLTGLSLALGMFMTYSTVVIGVFLCVIALLERYRFKQYLKMLLYASIGFVGFYVLLFILTGFQPFEALWASIKRDEQGMGGTGYHRLDLYFYLSIANLFAFLMGVGIPITTVWLRQLVKTFKEWKQNTTVPASEQATTRTPWILRHDKSDTFIIGFLITLLYFTFSTWFTMEVERIWIFMVPFFVIPVAKYLTTRSKRDFFWVAGLLVLQLIISEVLLYTRW